MQLYKFKFYRDGMKVVRQNISKGCLKLLTWQGAKEYQKHNHLVLDWKKLRGLTNKLQHWGNA